MFVCVKVWGNGFVSDLKLHATMVGVVMLEIPRVWGEVWLES